MNDAAVQEIWRVLARMTKQVLLLENKVEFLKGQVRARLKEEAESREQVYHAPRLHPSYTGKRPKA